VAALWFPFYFGDVMKAEISIEFDQEGGFREMTVPKELLVLRDDDRLGILEIVSDTLIDYSLIPREDAKGIIKVKSQSCLTDVERRNMR
tara:strand:+ start:178 stop:444 length:267 start_codon:yes stop_codon:yes gene_type:complete